MGCLVFGVVMLFLFAITANSSSVSVAMGIMTLGILSGLVVREKTRPWVELILYTICVAPFVAVFMSFKDYWKFCKYLYRKIYGENKEYIFIIKIILLAFWITLCGFCFPFFYLIMPLFILKNIYYAVIEKKRVLVDEKGNDISKEEILDKLTLSEKLNTAERELKALQKELTCLQKNIESRNIDNNMSEAQVENLMKNLQKLIGDNK